MSKTAKSARITSKKTKKVLLPKVKSTRDLYDKCTTEPQYRLLARAAVENLGAENLVPGGKESTWQDDVQALNRMIYSLVGEYGMPEDEAEESIVDEINFVRDCI